MKTNSILNKISQEELFQKINLICMTVYDVASLSDLLEISLKNTMDLFQAKRGSIFLLNEDGKGLSLKTALGMRVDEQENIVKQLGEGVVGRVAQSKQPLLVEDIAEDKRFENYKSRESYRTPSFICCPLMIKDKLIGVINISDKDSHQQFTKDELLLLDFLCNQIALNYQRALLNHRLKNITQESQHLKDELGKTNKEALQLKKQVLTQERLASLGKLAGGIAHEFNNPLDGVMRYTNLCLEHTKDDEILKEYLLEIKQGLKRMANIVKSLLACARNSQQPGIQKIDVNTTIEQVIGEFYHVLFQKNIVIHKNLSPDLPEITDLGVDRIVNNLIRNAIDAIEGNSGIIEIKTYMDFQTIKILVKDNGKGISQENMDKIFEPFFTTKKIEQGCGLGLTIVSEIVKYYNGSIDVETQPDQGTSFIVTLPI